MFSNTGIISFWLYISFIIITLIAMFYATYIIKKGLITVSKLNKLIELFKYSIVTVAITTVTLIVSDLFKEREQDIKELEYLDRYVADLKQVKGVPIRYYLSQYFATVAPSGEIKDGWKAYYDSVKIEYAEYKKLEQLNDSLNKIKNKTDNQILQQKQIIKEIRKKEEPLVPPNAKTGVIFVLAYPNGTLPIIFSKITGLDNPISQQQTISPVDEEVLLPAGKYRLEFREGSGFKLINKKKYLDFTVKENELSRINIEVVQNTTMTK
ncbi:hypothetical protein [Xanthocytophaga agilis]|uniref:Uncharacterized protein n=1 Tax=Xanthocytophaga agilis TaxID=3048010 RepID=A0AAE3R8W2_9BACT|nr:hypothetical protein [Xanthocytophaga agilis]MDJ1503604.1 hypothetical protein [Xanthocytophaga agilis]